MHNKGGHFTELKESWQLRPLDRINSVPVIQVEGILTYTKQSSMKDRISVLFGISDHSRSDYQRN
jgi:hypothetical protein